MEYPYKIVTEKNQVEIKYKLFPIEKENEFINEAKQIEIGTTYKLRPVILISQSELSADTYLALPLTKKKEKDTEAYRHISLKFVMTIIKKDIFCSKQNIPIHLLSIHLS